MAALPYRRGETPSVTPWSRFRKFTLLLSSALDWWLTQPAGGSELGSEAEMALGIPRRYVPRHRAGRVEI